MKDAPMAQQKKLEQESLAVKEIETEKRNNTVVQVVESKEFDYNTVQKVVDSYDYFAVMQK